MQPRLVAISYPSPPEGGDGGRRTKSEPQVEHRSGLHSRITKGLRKVSWQDWKQQLPSAKRRHNSLNDKVTYQVVQPWSDFTFDAHERRSDGRRAYRCPSKWQSLPRQVQANILEQLERAYNRSREIDVLRKRRNDLVAVQLSCKSWSVVAQQRLYETIKLSAVHDCDWYYPAPRQRSMRIIQLRRTLQCNATLASLVKHLVLLPEKQLHQDDPESYSNLVASVVVACPSLETLTSFHVVYTHAYNRLFHALATRTELTQHTWIIGEDAYINSRAGKRFSSGILSNQQTEMFLQHHTGWKNLETLNLISHRGRGILEHNVFVKTLNLLPSLKRLHVSGFDANDFTDETLLKLPSLTSLRLDRCPGISETGLCSWAQSPKSISIQRLVLESQNITSLLTISGLLSCLPKLEFFRLVQPEFEPTLPLELDVEQPLLASSSLRTLEWYVATGLGYEFKEFQESGPSEQMYEQLQKWSNSKSSQHILSSILDFGFPNLRSILLPGYGNLNGLLRWVRHTSTTTLVDTSKSSKSPMSSARSTIPSSSSTPISRRNSSRLSLRPSSPTFQEYDHWRRPPIHSLHEVMLTNIPEHGSTSLPPVEEIERPRSAPPTPSPSTSNQSLVSPKHRDPAYHSSDVESNGDDDDTSTASPPSSRCTTPVPTPSAHAHAKQSFITSTSFSCDTLRSMGHIEDAIAVDLSSPRLVPKEVDSPYSSPRRSREIPRKERSVDELPDILSFSAWDGFVPTRDSDAESRHSCISILLDGYAYTA